jgi:sugar (pentulose or hexulose) kinase
VCESNGGEAGSAYAWLLELLGATASADPYGTAESWVAPRDASKRAPLLFVGPAIFNLTTMNPYRPAGMLFPYPILEVGRPDRGALVQGLLENIAFAIRGNCEQIAQVVGRPIHDLRVSGGMSRGRLLTRILADVMNGPIQVGTVPDSAALGCAILGAVGLGLYADAAAAAAAMVRTTVVEPQAPGTYDEQYAKWREIYASLDAMTV